MNRGTGFISRTPVSCWTKGCHGVHGSGNKNHPPDDRSLLPGAAWGKIDLRGLSGTGRLRDKLYREVSLRERQTSLLGLHDSLFQTREEGTCPGGYVLRWGPYDLPSSSIGYWLPEKKDEKPVMIDLTTGIFFMFLLDRSLDFSL
jgi:hypothetical protein